MSAAIRSAIPDPFSGLVSIRLFNGQPIESCQTVEIIDQLLLPHQLRWVPVRDPAEAYEAIKAMTIRGAPAIGSLAALSLACGLLRQSFEDSAEVVDYVRRQSDLLVSARPTAVNLQEALTRVSTALTALRREHSASEPPVLVAELVRVCKAVWEEDLARNQSIGRHGAAWFLSRLGCAEGEKLSLLTVCNTGSLATAGYGTALGVITALHTAGRLEHVYYMQTGPYMQGARLTSLELQTLGIPCSMVCDTAAGWLIHSGRVHGFVAGADRIAANGDTANKISTYQLAVLCRHAHPPTSAPIPVLIAAPLTTFDLSLANGGAIEIEHRPVIEACTVRGALLDSPDAQPAIATVLVTPKDTHALNPAFDVTPAGLIDGIVSEIGVVEKQSGADAFDLQAHVAMRGQ